MTPAVVVDAVGRRCPVPVIELAKRIGDVEPGAEIGVVADDPAAAVDIPAWCRMRGQAYVGAEPVTDRPGATLYVVRRVS